MYLLITMTEIEDFVRPTDHIREEDFVRFGKHFMRPVQTGQDPEYSERLRDLVRDCLNPKIELRPTASSLVTRTRAGLEPYLISAATGNVPPAEQIPQRAQGQPGAASSPIGEPILAPTGVRPRTRKWEPSSWSQKSASGKSWSSSNHNQQRR
jgi:hypothetical protein